MTLFEILWVALGVTLTIATLALAGLVCALAPIGAERQRRRQDATEPRRTTDTDGIDWAYAESVLTGGRISPEAIQRFIDRGWLDPRPMREGDSR